MILPLFRWHYFALAVTIVGEFPFGKSLQSAKHSRLRLLHSLANSSFVHSEYYSTAYNVKDVQLGCKELRSKRYISDGYCTSVKPITEVVCAGICLPVAELPWYTELIHLRSSRQRSSEWRCVNDSVRNKRVHLLCRSGDRRTYKIKVVRSCKCKKAQLNHNKTLKKSNEV